MFSILVPMYNVEEFLSETLESILNQSFRDFELILVNDGSTDNTLDIALKYKELDDRIILINQENKGLVQARRKAINRAQRSYILIVDSDDFLEQYTLEILYRHINKTKSDLLLFKYKNVDKNGNIWSHQRHPLSNKNWDKDYVKQKFLLDYSMHQIWAKCFKSNLLKDDIINYNEVGHLNMNEDRLQSVFGVFNAKKICFIDEYLYNYRNNPNSLTEKFNKKSIYDSIEVYNIIFNYYSDKIDNNTLDKLVQGDAIQAIGKFYRWLSTNNPSNKETIGVMEEIKETDVLKRASKSNFKIKEKIIYNSIIKKNMIIVILIKYANKFRIFKQKLQ